MLLDTLLQRRLIVLTGKGGVGKSVVGASLALAARERGKRVLLVEVDAPLDAAKRLRAAELDTLNLDPRAVMDEYVRHVVRLELLARRVLASPIYDRFFAAAPGLKELMVLGKVMVLEQERRRLSREPRWDLIVVDAPATGHGLAYLKVPLAASLAVPVGPIGHNARRILTLLRDRARTALVVVATPEEMAVVEAIELYRAARDEVGVEPQAVVLNGCHERRFSDADEASVLRLAGAGARGELAPGVPLDAALRAARRQIRRRKLTRFHRSRLARALGAPLVSLPYLFRETLGPDELRSLARALEAA
jgi:anion-transporting  ArsA/GET3 family ATPase